MAEQDEETTFIRETLDRLADRIAVAAPLADAAAFRAEVRAIIKDELVNAALTDMVEDIRSEQSAHLTINTADDEREVELPISVGGVLRLIEGADLPDDWTSLMLIVTNPASGEEAA